MPTITFLHPQATLEHLGLIPSFLDPADPRPVREQINARYQHGGGWQPQPGWRFVEESGAIQYPGDPPLRPFARATLGAETIYFYPSAWVAVVQPDGAYEVARLD